MGKYAKHLFVVAMLVRCLLAPKPAAAMDCPPPEAFELAALVAVYTTYLAYETLVPFDWMEQGTVSKFLERKQPSSPEGDGSVRPLGFGFTFPDGQYPGEAASVALADVGALTIRHANIYGVQAGGVMAMVTDTCAGIGVGGLFAAAENVYGIQVGGLLASCRSDIYGIQVAGYANDTPGLCAGMQAGTVNMAGEVCGAQIGFTNCARDASGMQIGVVNVAQNMQGVQIGLVNIIRNNGMFPASPLVNMGF